MNDTDQPGAESGYGSCQDYAAGLCDNSAICRKTMDIPVTSNHLSPPCRPFPLGEKVPLIGIKSPMLSEKENFSSGDRETNKCIETGFPMLLT